MTKISTRFALLMAGAAVLPLLAYGAFSILSLRTGTQQAVLLGNLNAASRVAEQIELYVTSSVKILRAVAADLQQTGLQPWQQDRILKNFVLDFPEFMELTLLDDSGQAVVSSRLGAPTTDIPGADSTSIGGALLSRFSLDDDLLPTSVVAIRLTQQEGDGWLVGRLNLEELWRMVDRIRVGTQGYALVVANEGQLLAHGNPDAKSLVARSENLLDHVLVAKARNVALSPDGVASEQYESDDGRMLGVAAQMPALGWTVVVEQPLSEAFEIPNAHQWQLTISIGVALLAMLVVGYFWGRSFLDPILTLTRGTRALAEGRLDERVVVQSQDELGQLGIAFNNMADRLVQLQEDVRKTERQAMFGRMAIGLVHDLSQPIQNVGNSCKMMVQLWDDLEYRETFRKTTQQNLVMVKRVLDDLRNVARPAPLERVPLDLNKALGEHVESMQATAASSGVTLGTELVFGPLYIEGDFFALNRVYGNLITNALQATNPGGGVVVRTFRQDGHAIVEVADTGGGIPPERLATIFDDFVTTKRRGLGLGLAISKRIVEQLDGTLTVTSALNIGSTFTLRIPLTQARPAQLAAG